MNFNNSSIILLLIDANYLASDYAHKHQSLAIESGKPIIPVIMKPCVWKYDTYLSKINARPKFKGVTKPISEWRTRGSAYQDIVTAIVETIELLENNYAFNYSNDKSSSRNKNSTDVTLNGIRTEIGEGHLKSAIDKLVKYCQEKKNRYLNEAINYSFRINDLKGRDRIGIVDDSQIGLTQNKIVASILELVENIKNENATNNS